MKLTKEIETVVRVLATKFRFDYNEAIQELTKQWSNTVDGETHPHPPHPPHPPQQLTQETTNDDHIKTRRQELFAKISENIKTTITADRIATYKTSKGNTQVAERDVISDIKSIMDKDGITYTEAGSQQSKDFRNVGDIGLNIEIKKTDTNTIYFNDTCPSSDIFYVIFVTGKTTKKYCVPPQVICINGHEMVKDSPWVYEYQYKLEQLKNEYARGEGRKQREGMISVYPRPTYKADISQLIHHNLVVETSNKK